MSSWIFLLSFLLLVLNGASIALGVLPYVYGPVKAPQIAQITAAAIAFILLLLLPCLLRGNRRSNYRYLLAAADYMVVMLLDLGPAVYLTLLWQTNELEQDYQNVPKRQMIILMAVIVYWAAALVAIVCAMSSVYKAVREIKASNVNHGYQQGTPRELRLAPAARPFFTTYAKPSY